MSLLTILNFNYWIIMNLSKKNYYSNFNFDRERKKE